LNLERNVVFVGNIDHDEICDYYNLCDVFVMINRLESSGDVESFGMVFTEANAVGKPAVGGRSGGASEAVVDGETGFLADPENATEVADRLLLLLENEELRQRMGQAGLRRVRTDFNWNTRAKTLREISMEMVMRQGYRERRSS
jgi:phosphatidylinositol alpha-1,6-mannosyltransferase